MTVSRLIAVKVMAPSANWKAPSSQPGTGKFRGELVNRRMPRFSRT
jgi:hypothetical protein